MAFFRALGEDRWLGLLAAAWAASLTLKGLGILPYPYGVLVLPVLMFWRYQCWSKQQSLRTLLKRRE